MYSVIILGEDASVVSCHETEAEAQVMANTLMERDNRRRKAGLWSKYGDVEVQKVGAYYISDEEFAAEMEAEVMKKEAERREQEEIKRQVKAAELAELRSQVESFMKWWKGGVEGDPWFAEKKVARFREMGGRVHGYLRECPHDKVVEEFFYKDLAPYVMTKMMFI